MIQRAKGRKRQRRRWTNNTIPTQNYLQRSSKVTAIQNSNENGKFSKRQLICGWVRNLAEASANGRMQGTSSDRTIFDEVTNEQTRMFIKWPNTFVSLGRGKRRRRRRNWALIGDIHLFLFNWSATIIIVMEGNVRGGMKRSQLK